MSKSKKHSVIEEIFQVEVEVPNARALLDTSIAIISDELKKIKKMSEIGLAIPLDPEYMNALLNITKTLVTVDKNENDNPIEEDDKLTDEQLKEAARKA